MQKPCKPVKRRPRDSDIGLTTESINNNDHAFEPVKSFLRDIKKEMTGLRRRVTRELRQGRLSHDEIPELVTKFHALISRAIKGGKNQGKLSPQPEGYIMTTMNKVTYEIDPSTLTTDTVKSKCGHMVPLYTLRYLHYSTPGTPSRNLLEPFGRKTTTTWHSHKVISTIQSEVLISEVFQALYRMIQKPIILPRIPKIKFIKAGFMISDGIVKVAPPLVKFNEVKIPSTHKTRSGVNRVYTNVAPSPNLMINENDLLLFDKLLRPLNKLEALQIIYAGKATGPLAASVSHLKEHDAKWAAAYILATRYGLQRYARYLDEAHKKAWHACNYDETGLSRPTECGCPRTPIPGPPMLEIKQSQKKLLEKCLTLWQRRSCTDKKSKKIALTRYWLKHLDTEKIANRLSGSSTEAQKLALELQEQRIRVQQGREQFKKIIEAMKEAEELAELDRGQCNTEEEENWDPS